LARTSRTSRTTHIEHDYDYLSDPDDTPIHSFINSYCLSSDLILHILDRSTLKQKGWH
jgi:hypothetical protein